MDSLPYSIASLLYFVFHGVAFVLALVYWRRYPNVCLLLLIGSILNLLAMAGRAFLPTLWFRVLGLDNRVQFSLVMLVLTIVNLTGSSLYLLAIFTGRSSQPPRKRYMEDDDWDRSAEPAPPPPAQEPGRTGIQSKP